jgi:uncharacterized protein
MDKKRYGITITLLHFPPQPAILAVRKQQGSEDVEYVSLQTLVESRCPSLFAAFRPAWWLFKYVTKSVHEDP